MTALQLSRVSLARRRQPVRDDANRWPGWILQPSLSVCLSLSVSISLSISLSLSLSFSLPVCLSLCLTACLSFSLSYHDILSPSDCATQKAIIRQSQTAVVCAQVPNDWMSAQDITIRGLRLLFMQQQHQKQHPSDLRQIRLDETWSSASADDDSDDLCFLRSASSTHTRPHTFRTQSKEHRTQ